MKNILLFIISLISLSAHASNGEAIYHQQTLQVPTLEDGPTFATIFTTQRGDKHPPFCVILCGTSAVAVKQKEGAKESALNALHNGKEVPSVYKTNTESLKKELPQITGKQAQFIRLYCKMCRLLGFDLHVSEDTSKEQLVMIQHLRHQVASGLLENIKLMHH